MRRRTKAMVEVLMRSWMRRRTKAFVEDLDEKLDESSNEGIGCEELDEASNEGIR